MMRFEFCFFSPEGEFWNLHTVSITMPIQYQMTWESKFHLAPFSRHNHFFFCRLPLSNSILSDWGFSLFFFFCALHFTKEYILFEIPIIFLLVFFSLSGPLNRIPYLSNTLTSRAGYVNQDRATPAVQIDVVNCTARFCSAWWDFSIQKKKNPSIYLFSFFFIKFGNFKSKVLNKNYVTVPIVCLRVRSTVRVCVCECICTKGAVCILPFILSSPL